MKSACALLLVLQMVSFAGAVSTGLKKARLDINQKVYIENAPVLGDGAGEGILNSCQTFAAQHIANPEAPKFKVCGTGIKATVFLRNRCEAYYEHSRTIGKCDTGMPSDTCDSFSPAEDERFSAYQSYKV